MTLFAEVVRLIEVVWAALNTQLGAFQLQQRRGTCPARLGPRSCTQLTGLVTFMTLGALTVIPSGTMDDTELKEPQISWRTRKTISW